MLSQENLKQLMPNVDETDSKGRYAIREAVMSDYPAGIRAVQDFGGDIELVGEDGLTPLLLAAKENKYRAMRVLSKAGAKLDAQDPDGLSAIQHLARNGADKKHLLWLKEHHGVDLTTVDENGWSLLHHAGILGTKVGHEKLVKELLSQGLKVADEAIKQWDLLSFEHQKELKGSKPLFYALIKSSRKEKRLLPDLIVPLFMAKTIHGKRYLAEAFVCNKADEDMKKEYNLSDLNSKWALRMLAEHDISMEAVDS